MSDLTLFWSYSHADDRADRGRVIRLAQHLADEYAGLTGEEVELFVDRSSLRWGDRWRERIDEALTASTFMVSVLSPTYFVRPECRREMLDFHRQAESRGLAKLLLPIHYFAVSDLTEENPDELVKIASRAQYEDWTDLRLADPDSEPYRRSVNRLALRLKDLVLDMRQVEAATLTGQAASSQPEEYGFVEALAEIDKRLSRWRRVVEDDPVTLAQYEAVDEVYSKRILRAPQSQRLALLHQMASASLELAQRGLEYAREYSGVSIDMAPFVAAALRTARVSRSAAAALRPLYDAVSLAKAEIPEEPPTRQFWAQYAHLGGIFVEISDIIRMSTKFRAEGNALVEEWYDELREIVEA